jgi:hypothetical protein
MDAETAPRLISYFGLLRIGYRKLRPAALGEPLYNAECPGLADLGRFARPTALGRRKGARLSAVDPILPVANVW